MNIGTILVAVAFLALLGYALYSVRDSYTK
jgi:hypothetical protein